MQSLGQDYLATGSQVKYWPSRVHPWRLHRMHPCWWDRDVWDKKCGPEGDMWKFCWKLVGLFPSSSSMIMGCYKGRDLVRVGRTLWDIMADLATGCCCGRSTIWWRLAANLENIFESLSITTIWESPMLENGTWGAGFYRAWANSCAAMMPFYEEEL